MSLSTPTPSTSNSKAPSVVQNSSSTNSSSTIPISSPFHSHFAPLGSTTAMLSSSRSLAPQHHHQQTLYHHHQQQKHGQPSPSSAALLSNYNGIKNSARLPTPNSLTSSSASTSQLNRSSAPSTTTYDSALVNPGSGNLSVNQSSGSTGPDESGTALDVEIYLSSLDDSVSCTVHDPTDNNSTHAQIDPPQTGA